jgi:P27 family predicted phage terminase small subunit
MYEPPKGLRGAGLTLWERTVDGVEDGWKLDAHDLVVLEQCCRWADTIDRLQRRVDREGVEVDGSKGQRVAHPLLREVRMTRALLAANIGKVEISRPRATTRHLDKRGRDQLRDARSRRWR